jgi:hypothetical protein
VKRWGQPCASCITESWRGRCEWRRKPLSLRHREDLWGTKAGVRPILYINGRAPRGVAQCSAPMAAPPVAPSRGRGPAMRGMIMKMKMEDLAAFARRDWNAVAEVRASYWADPARTDAIRTPPNRRRVTSPGSVSSSGLAVGGGSEGRSGDTCPSLRRPETRRSLRCSLRFSRRFETAVSQTDLFTLFRGA